jgi:hypothetical protein
MPKIAATPATSSLQLRERFQRLGFVDLREQDPGLGVDRLRIADLAEHEAAHLSRRIRRHHLTRGAALPLDHGRVARDVLVHPRRIAMREDAPVAADDHRIAGLVELRPTGKRDRHCQIDTFVQAANS